MINLLKVFRLMLTITIIITFLTDNSLAASGWPLNVGQKVRLKTVDNPDYFVRGTIAMIDSDTLYLAKQNDFRIDKIIDRKGNTITFPYMAKYDPDLKILTGVDPDGKTVMISLEEIEKAELTLFAGGLEFDLQFDAEGFHDRVEYSPVFQDLVWQGTLNSITHLEIWQNNSLPRTIWSLCSITLGVIVGIDAYYDAKKEEERQKSVFEFNYFTPSPTASGIVVGILVGVGGLLLAKPVMGDDGWRKVSPEKLHLTLGPVGENSVGVVVALKF